MTFNDDNLKWRLIDSETLIDRPWMNVRRDRVQLPDGRIQPEYYVLHYPTWVNVVAETIDGKLIIERQYRHALDVMSTEICAGVVEKGEAPIDGARRELLEETGFGGGSWEPLMCSAPNPSTMDNLCYSFLARGVSRQSAPHLDPTEDLRVYFLDKEEVLGMLLKGEMLQAMMIAPLWKYFILYTDLLK